MENLFAVEWPENPSVSRVILLNSWMRSKKIPNMSRNFSLPLIRNWKKVLWMMAQASLQSTATFTRNTSVVLQWTQIVRLHSETVSLAGRFVHQLLHPLAV
jgi:hypothetical protein